MKKKLIRGGLVVDGTGRKGFQANVLVEGNRIAEIGEVMASGDEDIIDAAGLVVAPGFIDTHSHSDLKILVDPEVRPKVMQGITTEILGQDGISMAPLPAEYISPWRKNLAGLDGDSDGIDWNYRDTAGYLKSIEFNGEFVTMTMVDWLQAVPGLDIIETDWIKVKHEGYPYTGVEDNDRFVPEPGYMTLGDDEDVEIKLKARN